MASRFNGVDEIRSGDEIDVTDFAVILVQVTAGAITAEASLASLVSAAWSPLWAENRSALTGGNLQVATQLQEGNIWRIETLGMSKVRLTAAGGGAGFWSGVS